MIRFSLRNPLLVNLVLILVVTLGILSWHSMPQEMFPAFDRNQLQIRTTFEGASPEEVASQVTLPIEEALDSLTDIDTVTSVSQEGLSVINYKLLEGADADDLLRDMRAEIDAIADFPESADTPQLKQLKNYVPVISVALHGEAPMPTLYDLAERMRHELLLLPGVSGVGLTGKRDWEIWIELDPHELAARDVELREVTTALRNNLQDTPSGMIRSSEGDVLLRGMGAEDIEAIEAVAVRSNAQGGQLLIRDLGKVSAQLEEAVTMGRFNSAPSVNLVVSKSESASTYKVADQVRATIAQYTLPYGVEASLFADMSVPIENRINTVQSSGVVALVLLLFALYFLLNFRVAFITALGIPVAMLTAVIAMAALGYSINLVSMFAFLVVLGLVVDDAIIISENTYRHLEEGMEGHKAAYLGAHEVMWPVLASILTTIAAFIPMFGVSGTLGKFIEVIPVVVAAALLGSLLEAFLILPSHAAELLRRQGARREAARWRKLLYLYRRVLAWCVANRYLTASLTIGVLLITVAFMFTRLPYTQFESVELGKFMVNVEAPNTYGLEDSNRLAAQVEKAVYDIVEPYELESIQTHVGMTMLDFSRYTFGSNHIQFNINLSQMAPEGWIETYVNPIVNLKFRNEGIRTRKTEVIMAEIRDALKELPGISRYSVQRPHAGPSGADIEVGIVGPEFTELLKHSEDIRRFLIRLPGVEDVRHDLDPGKIEYQYALNDRGRELGLTQAELGAAVRMGYQGDKVVYISREGKRTPVRALYQDSMRHDSAAFDRLPITTANGVVYLHEVADIRTTRGLSTVRRRNNERMATVTADVDSSVTTVGTVTTLLNEEFGDRFQRLQNYQMLHLGAKKESRDSMNDLSRAALMALVLIFFILAALFKSVLDPLAVLATLPTALVGVVIGHVVAGINLQFLSLIGLLALAGVVINDSLILVSFVKQLRASGHECLDAVLSGSQARFRPILLTTVTTFFGVSPLIFFATGQTKFLAPMAISLGVGLLFATVLILLVLPCYYMILEDFRQWARSWYARWFLRKAAA